MHWGSSFRQQLGLCLFSRYACHPLHCICITLAWLQNGLADCEVRKVGKIRGLICASISTYGPVYGKRTAVALTATCFVNVLC